MREGEGGGALLVKRPSLLRETGEKSGKGERDNGSRSEVRGVRNFETGSSCRAYRACLVCLAHNSRATKHAAGLMNNAGS